MKKLLLTLGFAMCVTFSHSQMFYGGGGSVCLDCYSSIEVGAVSSNISGLDNSSQKIGFHFGYYSYKYVSETVTFRFGVSYDNLGATLDDPDNLLESNRLIIHSINFPLSVHYTYNNQFQGFAGGEAGTNFFGKIPARKTSSTQYVDYDFNSNFNLFDASVFVGAGYILANNIDINLKYNLGVTNVSKNDDNNWKKNWFTLSIAYTFRDDI